MSKYIAYTALLYGKAYLGYAIRSVIDQVDEYWVLYTPVGSHGSRTDERCPDTVEELYAIAKCAAGDKLRWCNGRWTGEGQQRDHIHDLVPDADLILVLDADEIWATGAAEYALHMAAGIEIRNFRVPFIHYWRSFHNAILHDPAFPIRIIRPDVPENTERTLWTSPVNHLGYAQDAATIHYKLQTHGHRGQFRQDCDWFNDVFLANRQRDCHPVGSDAWNPEPVNALQFMPAWMQEHPYWGMEVIP
jgi:hypothetical protein